MARPTQVAPVKEPGHALTAAAITYPGKAPSSDATAPHSQLPDQRDVWTMYGLIPEFSYAANWAANVSSRAALKVMLRDPATNVLSEAPGTHRAWGMLDELTGGREKQPEFIRQSILHFKVAGECSWVSRSAVKADGDLALKAGKLWEVVGTEEISFDGTGWHLMYEGAEVIDLAEEDVVIRAWVPHPKNRRVADSAGMRSLEVMREIRGYDFHIKAQQVSRLTGNGITFVPDSMTVKPPAGVNPSLTAAEVVTDTLMKVAAINKQEPGTAQAQIPLFVTARAEDIAAVKHLTFWSPLDANAHDMRNGSITRLATGLDTPKEVVTGTGDMNRWGAWQVDESAVKAHIEPDLNQLATLVSVEFIQPVLGPLVVIIADTSTLRLRPNRSKEAIELYDRGELSARALRRETGFNEDDAPDDEERALWIKMQMLKASWFPEQAVAAAKDLGVDIDWPEMRENIGREQRPTPSLDGHPVRDRPEKSVIDPDADPEDIGLAASAQNTAMTAAAATLAFRGMERAGNRLRSLTNKRPDVEREQTHTSITAFPDKIDDLLAGSFDCHDRLGLPPEIVARVDGYCRGLLETGRPFDFAEAIETIGAP